MYKQFNNCQVLLVDMNSMKIDSEERKGIGYFDAEQLHLVSDIVKLLYRKSFLF